MQKGVVLDLNISSEEYLKLYQGRAESVHAMARDGRSIRFPAHILRSFVTREGVRGTFVIHFDCDMKFQSIARI